MYIRATHQFTWSRLVLALPASGGVVYGIAHDGRRVGVAEVPLLTAAGLRFTPLDLSARTRTPWWAPRLLRPRTRLRPASAPSAPGARVDRFATASLEWRASLPNGRRSRVLEDALYAVIRTGGKQYRVEEGRSIKIERLPGEAGDTVELADVLLMAQGDDLTVGAPTIEGARVVGTIAEQGRSKKILVFHYKNKTRQRKKNGHRQQFTRLVVSDILGAGEQPKPKTAPWQPPGAATAVIEAPAAADETPAEKPKRARKKATTE